MLVNWEISYTNSVPVDKQPPDYYEKGKPYWFFKYFKNTPDVDVLDISSFPSIEHFEKDKLHFYILQTIRAIPKLNKYDVVISHGMQSGIVLCLYRRLFGKGKYKHIVFDIGAFNSAKESGRALKLMQFVGKSIDGIIYHTESQRAYYKRCHPWLLPRSQYIVFGTDPEYFSDKLAINDINSNYILSFGDSKRDWDTLIKAYSKISTNINLRIIGPHNLETEDNRIEVLGRVPIDKLKQEIAGAKFCILPLESYNYSYGQMTLLQQMAMGKAVIAANVPSISAYPISDDSGEISNMVLYQPENIDELALKIKMLIDNPKVIHNIGISARNSVLYKFNEKNMALEIEDFINKVLAQQ